MQERLYNWQLWAKTSLKAPVSCRSLESYYKCPQIWHPEAPRMPIDILDAIEVEKAIIKLPRTYLNLIVYSYIRPGYNFHAFCAKNRIRGNRETDKNEQFNIELARAETMLKNILNKNDKSIDRNKTVLYKETYNLTPELIAAV